MNRKISSGLTKIFQIAIIVKFIILTIITLITLFIFDLKTNIIIITCWIVSLFILKRIGITKLKTVYWNKQSLSIGNSNSEHIIPLTDIKNIKPAFLFDHFSIKITYTASGKMMKLYFLPKRKLFENFLNKNELIEALKKEI